MAHCNDIFATYISRMVLHAATVELRLDWEDKRILNAQSEMSEEAENKIYATALQISRYVDRPTDPEMYFKRPQKDDGAKEKLLQLANEFTHPSCCRWHCYCFLFVCWRSPAVVQPLEKVHKKFFRGPFVCCTFAFEPNHLIKLSQSPQRTFDPTHPM